MRAFAPLKKGSDGVVTTSCDRVHAERHPLSGASRFRGSGHDVDVDVFGMNLFSLIGALRIEYGEQFHVSHHAVEGIRNAQIHSARRRRLSQCRPPPTLGRLFAVSFGLLQIVHRAGGPRGNGRWIRFDGPL
jgi:hypothetical protein